MTTKTKTGDRRGEAQKYVEMSKGAGKERRRSEDKGGEERNTG